MTVTVHRGAGRRRVRERRLLAAGVLACGAVLLPAGAASAQEMMADGMMCPHAVGDMTNPATAPPPARTATNEAPLAARPAAVTAPAPAATKPAGQAPSQRAASSTGASTPATATAKSTTSAGAGAPVVRTQPVAQPRRAAVPVSQPQRTTTPVARPSARPETQRATPKRTSPVRRVVAPKVITTVIPEVTRPSAGKAPQATAAQAVEESPGSGLPVAIGGLLLLSALAVAVAIMRRRHSGGEAIAIAPDEPLEPSLHRLETDEVDEFDIALREWVIEARARELLGGGPDEPADTERPFASH